MLESEGVTTRPKKANERVGQGTDVSATGFPQWIAGFAKPAVAMAESESGIGSKEVEAFLEKYRLAQQAGDVGQLEALYVSFPESQRASVSAYNEMVEDLRIELLDVEIHPREHDARLTKFIVRKDGQLKFADYGE